jgi:hypothetical protein
MSESGSVSVSADIHRQIEPWAAPSFNRPLNRRVLRRLAAIRRASNSSAGMWIVLVAD